MLAASFIILGHPYPNRVGTKEADLKLADSVYNLERVILMIRCMRAFIIFSKWFVTCIDSPENKLLIKLMRGIEIFYYMGCILYQHYFVILHPPKDSDDLFVYRSKLFMVIEVILFYALIMTTIVFLAFI